MEPLGPTVVLARTNLICPLGMLILWSECLAVSTTFVAMASLRFRGPLTVTVYLFGRTRLELSSCMAGRPPVLTPTIVTLAIELVLTILLAKAWLLPRAIRIWLVLVIMRVPATTRLLVAATKFEFIFRRTRLEGGTGKVPLKNRWKKGLRNRGGRPDCIAWEVLTCIIEGLILWITLVTKPGSEIEGVTVTRPWGIVGVLVRVRREDLVGVLLGKVKVGRGIRASNVVVTRGLIAVILVLKSMSVMDPVTAFTGPAVCLDLRRATGAILRCLPADRSHRKFTTPWSDGGRAVKSRYPVITDIFLSLLSKVVVSFTVGIILGVRVPRFWSRVCGTGT